MFGSQNLFYGADLIEIPVLALQLSRLGRVRRETPQTLLHLQNPMPPA